MTTTLVRKPLTKDEVLDALNRIDEHASSCDVVANNDGGEAEALQNDYNAVFDYINSVVTSITIPFTENDVEELQSGEEFNWTFDGIDVKIIKQEEGEEESI